MQIDDFKRVVTTFADDDSEMALDVDGTLLLGIRGIEVEAKVHQKPDGVQVEHDGVPWRAEHWIYFYLAKLDRLADRIISSVSPPPHYVPPSGKLLNWKDQTEEEYSDAKQELQKRFSQYPVDMTLIYFLTSDAGEGKTSLINKISVDQAQAFKKNFKKTQTLILPVSLGGRPFLRLDDAVIASLSNKFRFPFLYYDSFIELVKMGAIIPAFDGYEEMFAETKSGEAISAIGELVDQLSSKGTLLVAARRAYFDSSLSSESKLLDPVRREQTVNIRRFALDRWSRQVFLKYAEKRNLSAPERLYEKVADRLQNNEHPVLTRAVLVRRLLDVANEEKNDLDHFLQRLGQSPTDYFFDFVESIIEREVNKWIDTSGTKKPLLWKDEHHELLSQIAFEMWVNGVETLGLEVIRLVIQIFAEEKNKSPIILRQINNRINHHSLLCLDDTMGSIKRIRFDHEDFQAFYLGQALARALNSRDEANARLILDTRQLSKPVVEEAARYLTASQSSTLRSKKIVESLHQLSRGEQHASYIRENCGALMLELAERTNITHSLNGVSFPANALDQRRLKNLDVSNSFFNSTSLSNSKILNCTFVNCRFVELALNGGYDLSGTIFDEKCSFHSVSVGSNLDEGYRKFYKPEKVKAILKNYGFNLDPRQQTVPEDSDPTKMDEDLKIALRFIGMFNRSTAVAENTVHTRIGTQSSYFFSNILPKLQKADLIEPIRKPGKRSRYRLVVPLAEIYKLVENSGSSFEQFIANVPFH